MSQNPSVSPVAFMLSKTWTLMLVHLTVFSSFVVFYRCSIGSCVRPTTVHSRLLKFLLVLGKYLFWNRSYKNSIQQNSILRTTIVLCFCSADTIKRGFVEQNKVLPVRSKKWKSYHLLKFLVSFHIATSINIVNFLFCFSKIPVKMFCHFDANPI